jgi:hypothetical protein
MQAPHLPKGVPLAHRATGYADDGISAAIDASRLDFILNEMRLPAIKTCGRSSPSTSSPNRIAAAQSGSWVKPSSCPARR